MFSPCPDICPVVRRANVNLRASPLPDQHYTHAPVEASVVFSSLVLSFFSSEYCRRYFKTVHAKRLIQHLPICHLHIH